MFFKEVNYCYLYNNTLKFIFQRKNLGFNLVNKVKLSIFFWYKRIQADEFKVIKFFDNLMFIWLLFGYKLNLLKIKTLFRLNVYYKYSIYRTNVFSFFKIVKNFDLIVNGLLLKVRKNTIQFLKINYNMFRIIFFDFSVFSTIKLGIYFYVENIIHEFYIDICFLRNGGEFFLYFLKLLFWFN